MADRIGRHEGAGEMNALDQRVDAQHFHAVSLRLGHGGIVADAHQQPRRRREKMLLDSRDEIALGEV